MLLFLFLHAVNIFYASITSRKARADAFSSAVAALSFHQNVCVVLYDELHRFSQFADDALLAQIFITISNTRPNLYYY